MNTAANHFTPALGRAWLSPLYDTAIRLMTREKRWRRALTEQIAPVAGDRILDVGCGTGSLLLELWRAEPEADYVGLDPDKDVLQRAADKLHAAGARVDLRCGFLGPETLPVGWRPTKVVSSLVLHQVPLGEKRRILGTVLEILAPGGMFHLADYGAQDDTLMRWLFRNTVQRLDGVTDTQPNADGILPTLMAEVGFDDVREARRFDTATGTIALYSARTSSSEPNGEA